MLIPNREATMPLLRSTLLAAAFTGALAVSGSVIGGFGAHAAGVENPGGMNLQSADPAGQTKAPKVKRKPAPREGKTKDKAPDKKSERPFIDGYRNAYALIYKQQDYAQAITALRALGRDEHPDVANLIGFASRKLGRTEDARTWYETALAADPNHTRTWQYYGMWHLERGDRSNAEQHLKTIEAICGTQCDDYRSLKLALAGDGFSY
jgi:tetratricopeptide (TPR) repeat protein